MTFDQEWAGLMSEAKERQSAGMRLNTGETPPGTPGAGSPYGLVVTQDDLGAVGNQAFLLHAELRKKADIAGAGSDAGGTGSTAQAAKELSAHNMTMGGELSTTLSVWDSQVKTVLQMCAHISTHLNYSKKPHAKDDELIEASMLGTAVGGWKSMADEPRAAHRGLRQLGADVRFGQVGRRQRHGHQGFRTGTAKGFLDLPEATR